jgi:hypothetical protein
MRALARFPAAFALSRICNYDSATPKRGGHRMLQLDHHPAATNFIARWKQIPSGIDCGAN